MSYERCDWCWLRGGSSVLCPNYQQQEREKVWWKKYDEKRRSAATEGWFKHEQIECDKCKSKGGVLVSLQDREVRKCEKCEIIVKKK